MEDYKVMLSVCRQLFDLWNQTGVRYCHWKSNEHLLDGLVGETDLDIYVDPNDKNLCEQLLKDCQYIILTPQKSSQYSQVDEWIGFDQETGKMVHVHLHYRLITGTKFCKEYTFPLGDLMISTRVLNSKFNVYVAAPELEIIVLFSRIVLKSKSRHKISAKGYEAEIEYLQKKSDYNKVHKNCLLLLGDKDGETLYSNLVKGCISDINWTEVFRVVSRWLRDGKTRSSISCWFRTKYYWFRLFYDIILNRWGATIQNKKVFPTQAISIAFIGQDGSGKSTVTKDIFKWLDWKVSAHVFYLGTGDGYNSLLKLILKSVSKYQHPKTGNPKGLEKQTIIKNETPKRNLKKRIVDILTCIYLKKATSSALNKIRQSHRYINKGGIALYDRYPQSQFPGIYDGPKIRDKYGDYKGVMGWIVSYYAKREEKNIKKISSFCPNIVFKLILSPEESIRRKPFENYELVKRKSEITEALYFPDSQVILIDASQNYVSELLTIKKHLWESFLKLQ